MPSLRSLPWILGAPHRGLAAVILLTRALIAASTGGWPAGRRPESVAQWRRKRRRCQRSTVAGAPTAGGAFHGGADPPPPHPKGPNPSIKPRPGCPAPFDCAVVSRRQGIERA